MLSAPALRHPVRVLLRLPWLLGELSLAAMAFPFRKLLGLRVGDFDSRSAWLQVHCRRVLRVLHVELEVEGVVPDRGLLACNHLSYVDILALGSLVPATFVAKHEVRGWPIFGWLARMGGTLFVRRDNPRASLQSTRHIQKILAKGSLVILFPEGTSSGGETVLPFKSTLLGGTVGGGHPVHAGCLHYPGTNGNVADEICYWRDMTLVPHLLNLLARRRISLRLGFTRLEGASHDRKILARQLHAEVLRMKHALAESSTS